MTLQDGLQLIVQYPSAHALACVGFRDLALMRPVLAQFRGTGTSTSDAAAADLGRATEQWIIDHLTARVSTMPCLGRASERGCHAWRDRDCTKLVVLVVDSPLATIPVVPSDTLVMPIVPQVLLNDRRLAAALERHNAYAHSGDPRSALQAVLGLIGVAEEERRIFVSYARQDSQALADQLYDALSRVRFNVFLDRFSLPPGRDFLRRIETELSDKAMVLLIESPRSLRSRWVAHELAHARANRMGIAAIRWHGPGHSIVRDTERYEPRRSDWSTARGRTDTLKPRALERVVEHVEQAHSRALARRRAILRRSVSLALRVAGARDVRYDGHLVRARSAVHASGTSPASEYVFSVTPRTPALADFYQVAQSVPGGDIRSVVGPRRFLESDRNAHLTWLGHETTIWCVDEGEILSHARKSASGSL